MSRHQWAICTGQNGRSNIFEWGKRPHLQPKFVQNVFILICFSNNVPWKSTSQLMNAANICRQEKGGQKKFMLAVIMFLNLLM